MKKTTVICTRYDEKKIPVAKNLSYDHPWTISTTISKITTSFSSLTTSFLSS
jgi:hypothetical protein